MKTNDQIITTVLNKFQEQKGHGSMYCFSKSVIPSIINAVISRILAKRSNAPCLILVPDLSTRTHILKSLKELGLINDESNIKCLTADFVKNGHRFYFTIVITVGINDDFNLISKCVETCKFVLSIFTENIMDNCFINAIREILPSIDINKLDNEISRNSIYSPVEEHRVKVGLNQEDKEKYDKCTDYINTTISILHDLDTIQKARLGDPSKGLSANDVRYNIAVENGWRYDLDMNVQFMKAIDDLYSPTAIEERAHNFYNVSRERRDIIVSNKEKLHKILNICKKNNDKKIIIMSKQDEFAAMITKYLNDNGLRCGDYHDHIEDSIAIENGNIILIKSGPDKGKPKIMKAKAQSTLNAKKFKTGEINILSMKCAADPKITIDCDIVIFTSPMCGNIIDMKQRFSKIAFNETPTITYVLYTDNTVEMDKFAKDDKMITVIEDEPVMDDFVFYNNSNEIIV